MRINIFLVWILCILNSENINGQIKIADWLPGCLPAEPAIKLGMVCNGGTTNFGVIAGIFTVQNIDGITCCVGPMGGGDGNSYFEFEPVNISCFTNVTVTMNYSAAVTGYEDNDPANPIFGCTGNNPPDNSHDQIVFMYSIDGGPFIQSLYVHGTTAAEFTGTWTQGGLSGTTLTIKVFAANKATAEIFRFQNMDIVGTSTLNAGPDDMLCFPDPAVLDAGCTGSWSGGSGTFTTPNQPTTSYIPSAGENGSTVTLTFTSVDAGTPTCPVNNSDDVMITFNPEQDGAFTFPDWCLGDPNGPTNIITPGGTFVFNPPPGDGATINPSTGVISGATAGSVYSIIYTTPGPCPGMGFNTATVNPAQNAIFTFPNFCVGDFNGPTNPGTPGGTFSFNPPSGNTTTIDPVTGEITNEVAGTYTVQYTTPGPCPDTRTVPVTISPSIVIVLPSLGPFCTTSTGVSLPTTISGITGEWSGAGVTGGNLFNPSSIGDGTYTLTFTPDAGQCANIATTPVVVIASPIGNLIGSPVLCPGQCGEVMFSFTGGSGTYNIDLQIMAGPFNFTFPIVGVTNSTVLTLCLNNGTPFDPATNTVNIPTFVPPGTYSLSLVNFSSTPAGPCSGGVIGVPGTISVTIGNGPVTNDDMITMCDFDMDGIEIFDLTTVEDNVKNNVAANTVTWYSDAALTMMISNPSAFQASNPLTQIFAVVTASNGCSSPADVFLIIDIPTAITLNDFALCLNDPLLNLPTTVATIPGMWTGANVIGGSQFDPTGLSVGNYPITFVPAVGQCILPLTVDVVISSGSPIPLPTPYSTVCASDPNIVLPTDIGGVAGIWSGSFISGNVFNVTAAGAGIFVITFTPLAGCFSANTTTIAVNPAVTLTPPVFSAVCAGSPNVNLPSSIGGVAGDWSGIGVTGNIFNPNLPPDTYILQFIPTLPCAIPVNSIIIVNPATPLVPPVLGPTCVNGNVITLPPVVSGISGTWTFNSVTVTSFNPATLGIGNYTHVFTPAGSNPCILPFTVVISVGQIFAGSDVEIPYCRASSGIINLTTFLSPSASLGGTWSFQSVTIPNPTTFNISALPAGSNTFRYALSDVICGQDTADIALVINNPNNAGADPTTTNLCQNNTNFVNLDAIVGLRDANGTWLPPVGASLDFTNIDSVNLTSLGAGSFVIKYIIPVDGCPADTSSHTFVISAFNNAGMDDLTTSCIGSSVNLTTLINTSYLGGTYDNPNIHPGLTGTIWNTTGLSAGPYNFLYIANNLLPCAIDTAKLTINLAANISAGIDQADFYCEDEIVNLDDFLKDPAGAKGGSFYRNGLLVPNGVFDTKSSVGDIVFLYIVGDGVSCPKDTAIITLTRIQAPVLTFNMLSAICEDDCTTLKIEHNITIGSKAYFKMVNSLGIVTTTRQVSIIDAMPILLQFCGASMPPYNFNNLAPNLTYTVSLDSVVTTGMRMCAFDYGQLVNFAVKPRPTKNVTGKLCKGAMLQVGNDVYSETKLSGTSVIAVPPNIGCDTVVTVNLTLINATPPVNIKRTTCNQAFSLMVGTTIFNKSNPVGAETLKNAGGCDSIVNVDLTFINPPSTNFTFSTCDPNYSIVKAGITFNQSNKSGVATFVNGSVFGCDSTVNVSLTFLSKGINNLDLKTCDDAFSRTIFGKTFNKSNPNGPATLANGAKNGCDSIVNVNIEFIPKPTSNLSLSFCDDAATYTLGNETFSKSRPSGPVTFTSAAGCDSTVFVSLDFRALMFTNSLNYQCDESEPTLNIILASQPGPYTVILNNAVVATNQVLPYSSQLPVGDNQVILETPQGCRDTLSVKVEDNSAGPAVSLSQTPLLDGFTQINTIAPLNVIYDLKWSPSGTLSCNDCPDPVASPAPTTMYLLTYHYGNDCLDTVSIVIKEIPNKDITIANVILLGSNGGNGTFYVKMPEGVSALINQMSIYDRWGNLVFNAKNVRADDPTVGWNGLYNSQPVNPGVFVYFIELQIEGKSKVDIFKGDLTVIR